MASKSMPLNPERGDYVRGVATTEPPDGRSRPVRARIVGGRAEYANVAGLAEKLWMNYAIAVVDHVPAGAKAHPDRPVVDLAIVLVDISSTQAKEEAKNYADRVIYTTASWASIHVALGNMGYKQYSGMNLVSPGVKLPPPAPPAPPAPPEVKETKTSMALALAAAAASQAPQAPAPQAPAPQATAPQAPKSAAPPAPDWVDELRLSYRTGNIIRNMGWTREQLLLLTDDEIRKAKNVGPSTLKELQDKGLRPVLPKPPLVAAVPAPVQAPQVQTAPAPQAPAPQAPAIPAAPAPQVETSVVSVVVPPTTPIQVTPMPAPTSPVLSSAPASSPIPATWPPPILDHLSGEARRALLDLRDVLDTPEARFLNGGQPVSVERVFEIVLGLGFRAAKAHFAPKATASEVTS